MTPEGNPALGFLYLCLMAGGIAALVLIGWGICRMFNEFARLVALHMKGWR